MAFYPILFFLGLAIGSFLNVIAVRYQPEKNLLHAGTLGGRSHCSHCGKQLRWFELIPLVSFLVQGGLCRFCKHRLSFQYPLSELVSGIIFIIVPWRLGLFSSLPLLVLWILIFSALLLIALVDIRLRIIPNELIVFLFLVAVPLVVLGAESFDLTRGSFIGHYALLFGGRESIWLNHLFGFLAGAGFFLVLLFITKGRGVGGGDIKLSAVLGLIFGWPDILILIPLSFILGSLFVLPLLLTGQAGRKDMVPFGPFLVLASILIFLFGFQMVDFYFHLFRI